LRQAEHAGITPSGYAEYAQYVDEAKTFNGRAFLPNDEWIGGILYADYLGIAFAERVADLPQFVQQVEVLSGIIITSIRGTASKALPGDPLLIGDWIERGTFDPDRLARKFEQALGGKWSIIPTQKDPHAPDKGYNIEINRQKGT